MQAKPLSNDSYQITLPTTLRPFHKKHWFYVDMNIYEKTKPVLIHCFTICFSASYFRDFLYLPFCKNGKMQAINSWKAFSRDGGHCECE